MMGLPKEVAAFVLGQGERTRREVTRLVGRELRRVISQVDWAREARRLMRGMRLRVRADIAWVPVARKEAGKKVAKTTSSSTAATTAGRAAAKGGARGKDSRS